MDDLNFDVDLTTPLDGCLINDFMQQSTPTMNTIVQQQHSNTSVNSNPSPSNSNNMHLHNQQQQQLINRQQVEKLTKIFHNSIYR